MVKRRIVSPWPYEKAIKKDDFLMYKWWHDKFNLIINSVMISQKCMFLTMIMWKEEFYLKMTIYDISWYERVQNSYNMWLP
jgi:hypothetical protein